jgi:hypothetical protein
MKAIIFICITLLTHSGFAQVPNWYVSGEMENYSPKFFISATGMGENYNEAVTRAHKNIAAQIQISIEAKVESSIEEFQTGDSITLRHTFRDTLISKVRETIAGVQIVKRASYREKYYVYAVLNRGKYARGLQAELNGLDDKITLLTSSGKKALNEGRIFTAVNNFIQAQDSLDYFRSKRALHDAIAAIPYDTESDYAATIPAIGDVLSNIFIKVISGEEQTVQNGASFNQPIIAAVIYKGADIETPIAHFPLKIMYKDKMPLEKKYTDAKGLIKIRPRALPFTQDWGGVIITPDLFRLPTFYRPDLKRIETEVRYFIRQMPPLTLSLVIKNEQGVRLSKIENKFITELQKLDCTVSENANLILSGVVTVEDIKAIESFKGTAFLAKIEANIALIDKANSKTFGAFSITAKGLSDDKNREKAVIAAYSRLKVDKKKLAVMLVEAQKMIDIKLHKSEPTEK